MVDCALEVFRFGAEDVFVEFVSSFFFAGADYDGHVGEFFGTKEAVMKISIDVQKAEEVERSFEVYVSSESPDGSGCSGIGGGRGGLILPNSDLRSFFGFGSLFGGSHGFGGPWGEF